MKIAGRQAQVRKRQGSYSFNGLVCQEITEAEYSTTQRKDVYTSTSRPFVSQGIHGVKQEVQAECERLNPDVKRLEDGPKIWFDAARDTIFDAMSLYSLKQFTDNNPPTTLTAQHHGFDLIQNLETPLSTTAGCLDRARNYFSARPIKWNLPVTRRKYHTRNAVCELVREQIEAKESPRMRGGQRAFSRTHFRPGRYGLGGVGAMGLIWIS
ncbi:hypothetical protein JHW43_006874 [Diplocarpon mali]|nr:hypothetical protein JHW43_006874 [Diplocarpon mali]